MNELEILYKELLEREAFLEKNHKESGRISEIQLCIIRVQQLLLGNLKKD